MAIPAERRRARQGIIFLIFVGGFLCFAIYQFLAASDLERRGRLTDGAVVSRTTHSNIRYAYTVDAIAFDGFGPSPSSVGQTIRVLYLPEDPGVSAPADSQPKRRTVIAIIIASIMMVARIGSQLYQAKASRK